MKFNGFIMGIMTDRFITEYEKQWIETTEEFPNFDKLYDSKVRKKKQLEMEAVVNKLLVNVEMSHEYIENVPAEWGTSVKALLREAGDDILELDGGGMKKLLDGGYCKVTSDFIEKAHFFDTKVSVSDILQALRNAWIMNCLQVLLQKPIELTPSLFGYSMLYPYTDNYLDSTGVSRSEKHEFGKRFRSKLEGIKAVPKNSFEKSIFELVDMIETQFSRECYPKVYESLLEIHDAQQKGLQQQNVRKSEVTDITGISIYKGGSSVLADGYLVDGNLSKEQAAFVFGFGVFLQFADDAQDVAIDKKNKHITVFSQAAGKTKLDGAMNKLMNFMMNILDNDKCFCQPHMIEQKNLIKSACLLLLFMAVSNHTSMYSRQYVKNLEKHSPLKFSYLRKLNKRVTRECGRIFQPKKSGTQHMDVLISRVLSM